MSVSTPRDALIHEIALAIEGTPALAALAVHRGYPEDADFSLPAVSITATQGEIGKAKRDTYRETELPDGTLETIYETSRREFIGSIELWTGSKTAREPLELALDGLLEGELPDDLGTEAPRSPGLVLTLSRLYDARVRVLAADKGEQDASGGRDGYFRVVYSFTASVPYLRRMIHRKAAFTVDENETVVTTDQETYDEA